MFGAADICMPLVEEEISKESLPFLTLNINETGITGSSNYFARIKPFIGCKIATWKIVTIFVTILFSYSLVVVTKMICID